MQTDEYLLTVCRYVERNALRAKLVDRAEAWRWSSLWRTEYGDAQQKALVSEWADMTLVSVLRSAFNGRTEMEIRWSGS